MQTPCQKKSSRYVCSVGSFMQNEDRPKKNPALSECAIEID
jgi:hypothetical protein